MLVNELTSHELRQIIKPVIRLEPMPRIISEIGKVVGISQPTRIKIQKQDQFLLRYKGFDVFISDLRWLRGRGPSISLQFKRPSTKLQSFLKKLFPQNHKMMDMVCREIIEDLKTACLGEIKELEFSSTDVNAHSWAGNEEFRFRVAHPRAAFNEEWKEGRDIAPLMISDEFHSEKWFILFSFNAAGFIRSSEQTMLRKNWHEHAADVSNSINASLGRNYYPDDPRQKSFEEWSEDMILDLGDEIIPELPTIWKEIHKQ
jgi:hypothetical protein